VTPSSFDSAVDSADPGDVLVLSSGAYGTFSGENKPGAVTIKAAPGANASMQLRFRSAANLVFDGLTFGDIEMSGSTHGITVRNSTITGQTVFRTGELQNANILFDHNVHPSWDKCDGCGEGRVFLPQKTSQPSGITIQNSRFGPGGDSDGIQNGSRGTRILNNEFAGIRQIQGGAAHADAIQLYGSSETLIQGNWFHDVSVGIMAPDGADHERILDNVIQATSPYAIQLGSDEGSVIRHNTLPDGRCEYNKRCGIISLGAKSGNPESRGTVIDDNILAEISWQGTTVQSEDYNLFAVHIGRGSHDTKGMPRYVGGAQPKSYAGFQLAPGSNGKGTASDGTDRGARIHPAGGPPAAGRAGKPRVRLLSGKRTLRRRGVIRLRVRPTAIGTVALALRVRPAARRHVRPVKLRPRVLRFARVRGRTVKFKLSRHARHRVRRWGKPRIVVRTFSDAARRVSTGRVVLRVKRR
jgi:hypothetical protein